MVETKIRRFLRSPAPWIAAVVALASAWFLWPTPLEKKLKAELEAAFKIAVFTEELKPLEARLKAKQLSEFLAEQVTLDYNSRDESFTRSFGRDRAHDALTGGLLQVKTFDAGFSRFALERADKGSATVRLFVVAEWKREADGDPERAAEDTRLTFRKNGSRWEIAEIETLAR